MREIRNYSDFVEALLKAGFSMGGGNSEGIFALIPWGWNETPPYDSPVNWHTGDKETDPWEWRMRVFEERDDIAYAKVFFKKSGYITKAWAPYFLAARRSAATFEEDYSDGNISADARRIYETVAWHEALPLELIKQRAGFGKAEKSAFDRALVELQMKLYVTMCGKRQKLSNKGEEYGWSSTVFCTTEVFWGGEVMDIARLTSRNEAIERITAQVRRLNMDAAEKKTLRFITG